MTRVGMSVCERVCVAVGLCVFVLRVCVAVGLCICVSGFVIGGGSVSNGFVSIGGED